MTHYYKYYVYTLAYPDGRIFYVGKGQGDRIHQHEKEADCYRYPEVVPYLPEPSAKILTIHKIWAAKGKVVKTKVFETDDEQEANDYEKRFIAQCDQRYLTNLTRGGGPQFSKRDPYARIKHRELYYSPQEACEKLGVSQQVWSRLVRANVLNFYRVEGCTLPVLHRQEIDNFAERIHKGTYPIDAWEMTPRAQQASSWDDSPSPQPTEIERPKSRLEMLQDAAAFALEIFQQTAPSYLCNIVGSYEKTLQYQEHSEQGWEIHLRIGQEEHIYTVGLQQNRFVLINVSPEKKEGL